MRVSMRLALGTIAAAAILGGSLAQPARAQNFAPSDLPILQKQDQDIKQVKPGLYMVVGAGGNTTVRVTPAGLIIVDTKNPGDAIFNATMGQIRTVSDKPVKYAVVTHHHADHSGNSGRYAAAGATVIGQANEAKHANDPTPPNRERMVPPTKTYDRHETLRLGGARAELYHFDRGHTDGDTVVYFPREKTVAMGDLFTIATPLINYSGGGSALGASRALHKVMALKFDTVIPGHGFEPVSRERLARYVADLDRVIAAAKAEIKAGVPKDQLFSRMDVKYLSWNLSAPQWSSKAQLDGFYDELSKAP
jgi:glyoxylase-like metal-dependent hydrolase (beta-lactamase superfamily II)